MKKIPLLLLTICTVTAFGQKVSYSVHAGTTLPIIATVEQTTKVQPIPISSGYGATTFTNTGTIREKYDNKAGFYVSGRVTIKPSSTFFITTGIGIQSVRYERSVTIENLGNETIVPVLPTRTVGSPFSSFFTIIRADDNVVVDENRLPVTSEPLFHKPNGSVTNTFIQVPILAGTSLLKNKLAVRAGACVSYLTYASNYKQNLTWSYQDQYPTFCESKEQANDDFTTLSAGVVTEVSYAAGKHFTIDFSFQKNFNALYAEASRSGGKAKLNLLSLGIGYSIGK
jgi:hypothetical protein